MTKKFDICSHTVWKRDKGGLFSFRGKRIAPPYTPQEKGTRGLPPRPRSLQTSSSKSCGACRIGSLPSSVSKRFDFLLSSLPLCLRFVTLTQFPSTLNFYCFTIACRGGIRRKLVCTLTQQAERQRVVPAETSRMSSFYGGERSNATMQGLPFRRRYASSSCRLSI